MVSLADDLEITTGSRADWAYFARWHYRSRQLGPVRFVTVLWHGRRPVGICVFTAPSLSLAGRNRYFGRSGRWSRLTIGALNRHLVCLSRIVLHPAYRGAGLAGLFLRRSCVACPFDWIESLAELGRFHRFFERAGFQRIEIRSRPRRNRRRHSDLYGGPRRDRSGKRLLGDRTHRQSDYADPVYYIFDNRPSR